MAKVREFMTTNVVTIPSDGDLYKAACLMRDSDIGVLPVVDGGELKGVVTDRDLVIRGLAERRADAKVGEIVSSGVVCLAPDDDEKDAKRLMMDNDIRRLPVVDKGKLVGMVSVGDLAVRTNEKLAGQVMEETGPEK
jgi:CBS domain-containing protein